MISEEDIKNIKEDLAIIRNTQTKGVYNSYRIDQAIEYIEQLESKVKELETERDYYKKMYLEFNNLFIDDKTMNTEAMLKDLEKRYEIYRTCLHCGEGKPAYCERLLSGTYSS